MKISKETLAVLKALGVINSNLLIKPGSTLNTISQQKNVMASIAVEEDFPSEFAIYDMSEFLAVLSLFADPDVEFSEKYVKISEGTSSITYYAADASILVVPQKEIKFPASDVDFVLPAATLAMALKTAGVLRSSDLSIVGNGKEINIVVADLKTSTANSFKINVGTTDETFNANLKVDNLKLIPGEYNVSLSSKKISKFKHTEKDATFFIALEASSSFE
jgi:hypothetical protein